MLPSQSIYVVEWTMNHQLPFLCYCSLQANCSPSWLATLRVCSHLMLFCLRQKIFGNLLQSFGKFPEIC